MLIVINTTALGQVFKDQSFIFNFFNTVAKNYSNNSFVFLVNNGSFSNSNLKNVKLLKFPAINKVTFYTSYQYRKRIAEITKKYKADLLITHIIIPKTFLKIPQIILLPDLTNLLFPAYNSNKKNVSFIKVLKKSVHVASGIFVSEVFWKEFLVQKFDIAQDKVIIINNYYSDLPKPISISEKLYIKEVLTEGKEFFLIIDDLIDVKKLKFLLKAFGAFKKRMKSTMKIVFVLNNELIHVFTESIAFYKYKNDVVLQRESTKDIFNKYLSSAYAVIVNSDNYGFESIKPIIISLETPILAADNGLGSDHKINKNFTLFYKGEDVQELSNNMIKIYKEETLRKILIESQTKYLSEFERISIITEIGTYLNLQPGN